MAIRIPNSAPVLSAETCEYILDGISVNDTAKAVAEIKPEHPELDDYRDGLMTTPYEWQDESTSRNGINPAHYVGIGFDAGRYLLSTAGIVIPRVPLAYLCDISCGDRLVIEDDELDKFFDCEGEFEGSFDYQVAGWHWSEKGLEAVDEVDKIDKAELVDLGFAHIYVVAAKLIQAGIIASN